MSPVVRRVIYVVTYEFIAIVVVTIALTLLGHAGESAGITAVASSLVALTWNFIWTSLFEMWEARQASQVRTVKRRIAHAIGFEGGLVVILVPVVAWVLGITLIEAFILDLGLLFFFLIYTFVFAWVFDIVLPKGGRRAPTAPIAE